MAEGKVVWRSPNNKWEIRIESPRFETDWDDGYSDVAVVSASDGWKIAYASIQVNGRLHTGDYMTNWEYFVPKFVEQKAFSILRAEYKKKKEQTIKKSNLPYQYLIQNTYDRKQEFAKTYDTAIKKANQMQKSIPAKYSNNDRVFVNLYRFSKSPETLAAAKAYNGSFSLLKTIYPNEVKGSKKRK